MYYIVPLNKLVSYHRSGVNLYSSHNVMKVIKWNKIRCADTSTNGRNQICTVHKTFIGKPKRQRRIQRPSRRRANRPNIKMDRKDVGWEFGDGSQLTWGKNH